MKQQILLIHGGSCFDQSDILIIGAGASGLMAARELAKAGKRVVILEARNRIGGRIMSFEETDFGYPAEGGAEWVHGKAPITKDLIKEAGLTLIPEDGEIWSMRNGDLKLHTSFIEKNHSLKSKLDDLKEDISISDFLENNFDKEKDADFINSIIKMVEGYDAADPKLISTFALRDEWLGKSRMTEIVDDNRIKEGYGALINFLESECKKYGVEIYLNTRVVGIDVLVSSVSTRTENGEVFKSNKVIITVPLPVFNDIEFNPELKWKKEVASNIGFGSVIKILIKFKSRWWENTLGKDLSKMSFLLCNEKFLTWWTQYPEINNVLTAWMAGPEAKKYKEASSDELLDIAIMSISNVLKVDKEILKGEIVSSKVVNWSSDPLTKGAYSYQTYKTGDAYEQLIEPHDNVIFFAGEALSIESRSTVEGALGSGVEVAKRILK